MINELELEDAIKELRNISEEEIEWVAREFTANICLIAEETSEEKVAALILKLLKREPISE